MKRSTNGTLTEAPLEVEARTRGQPTHPPPNRERTDPRSNRRMQDQRPTKHRIEKLATEARTTRRETRNERYGRKIKVTQCDTHTVRHPASGRSRDRRSRSVHTQTFPIASQFAPRPTRRASLHTRLKPTLRMGAFPLDVPRCRRSTDADDSVPRHARSTLNANAQPGGLAAKLAASPTAP